MALRLMMHLEHVLNPQKICLLSIDTELTMNNSLLHKKLCESN